MRIFLVSIVLILVALALLLLSQSFWDAVGRFLMSFGQIFLGNAFTTRKNIWSSVIENKKRRYSVGVLVLVLGIILFILSGVSFL
ncbi:MAG: hypothetical protein WCO05_02555 [Candidatus Moraniibacteriota bacterium]|jgi:hypothetical protein